MEEFGDVAKARASWDACAIALRNGREIMRRAGVQDPPPIPEFDTVFRRLDAAARAELFSALRDRETPTPAEALRIWQPLLKQAFGSDDKRI